MKSVPVDDATANTYGGAGWDHYQFSLAAAPRWMTEWCDISGSDENTAAVNSATHLARDLINDGVSYLFWWNSYIPNPTPGSANLVYGTAAAPKTTKVFRLLKRLFRDVPALAGSERRYKHRVPHASSHHSDSSWTAREIETAAAQIR